MNTEFITSVESFYGKNYIFSRKELAQFCQFNNLEYPNWLISPDYKISRGTYMVPSVDSVENVVQITSKKSKVNMRSINIPEKDSNFVPFGFYKDLKTIIKSGIFYPVYITGETGSGKTYCVEQVCAELGRECIRVNFSTETDQTDLLGGNTLIDGNIEFSDGPIITAMRNGSILLLDELDRCNSTNVLILNGILEGNSYYNPKTNELIHAKDGFNVICTANTKGAGSDDGKYLSQILDSAFLERFAITWEQEYPDAKVEKKILMNHLSDENFVDDLVKWTQVIRQTYVQGGIDEIISTRRLVHIAKTYNIFKNKKKSVELCVSRFDLETKNSFIDLYTKITEPSEGEELLVNESDIGGDIGE